MSGSPPPEPAGASSGGASSGAAGSSGASSGGASSAGARPTAGREAPMLPDQTTDDVDRGWGDDGVHDVDEYLRRERPPHWDR